KRLHHWGGIESGLCPLFYFGGTMNCDSTVSRVWDIAVPLVADEGLEIVDIEFRCEGRGGWVLRVYLDKEGGTNVGDLTRVSRQLSDLLDVHDVIQRSYTLEISTPGVNRVLKMPEHFGRFVGKRIRLRTREMIEGRKSFLGLLKETTQDGIVIFQERMEVYIPHSLIEKANYEHDWNLGSKP
ncbi:MAG: ribosome maturation factor RimP, partial [Deltaproteobacteria bacterium]|nr:ribosome maturation factor RimP [Deltaproteobacteria bacterium]